ncbi:MAG: NADH-quinone oxidoreductase subunit NuoD [Candidatus Thermofonsia Clade 1 bacterium]|jgi:NADH-quinone oxidoreductase subunit D/NADH-quinone oxidoreductase subunit C/D|uniref:NADH-quinone oxidoreductase subunit D n=1 Tax=Candidatus Thermofonsia Clade 1 bacterium TaxID=2364210 RepID=A0A2M8PET3_9CHLR|nr:MAG: NADH-quinone oxidoreductase subunit NuoD [Candidatus Thermofonsia Clade 1 bacterium]RMF51161.1 MAG: NADH-quinone oxidoreductase subunit NuoD [Chloroflexota bacterium]
MTDQVLPQVTDLPSTVAALKERFPNAVKDDTRSGYQGVIVDPAHLTEFARVIRDEFGFNYLSSVTAVDYLGHGDHLEVVYHAYRVPSGGKPLVFKAQTDRNDAVVPSLVSIYPGADFQEREAYDLYGIHFVGHPNLKRILLWEGFEGYPMRKDYHEAYYEQETKPFDSRWPGGHVFRAEEYNPFGHNVRYPAGFTLDDYKPVAEEQLQQGMALGVDIMGDPAFRTDRLIVNLGPHHPSTHGVFRMMVALTGETIESLEPVMGYLHRNHEKIGERNTWYGNMPFTDRLDYICSMANNLAYAITVEQMMGNQVSVPYRAEVIRVLMAELTRITNHLWAIGFLLNDLGAFFTPALYAIQTREYILDFFEATAGSRMMCNYMRIGGVAKDLMARIRSEAALINDKVRDMDTMEYLDKLINDRLPRSIDELDELLSESEIIKSRCIGVGLLPAEMAIAYSASGPLLRASGVPYDIRRADPYSIYPELEFDICTRPNGDIYDRYYLRLDEMRQSVRILKQILPRLKDTQGQPIFGGKTSYSIKVPAGEAYGHAENPKGELGFYCVSTGGGNPWRYHVRAPSFINLTPLGEMCKGQKVADVVAILGSIDIVLGETDR